MYSIGKYMASDKMGNLICDNYPMLLVMSRFNISLGFGDKSIGEVCKENKVDTDTFLSVINLLIKEEYDVVEEEIARISIPSLIDYLKNSHSYFLEFRLPMIRQKLGEALKLGSGDITQGIMRD